MFCMECGTKLPDAAKYCMICGTKVGTVRSEDGPSEEEMFLEVAVVSRPVSSLIHPEEPAPAPVAEPEPIPEPEPEPAAEISDDYSADDVTD